MNEITYKPIQERYKGYVFRSHLEAQWAVGFDTYNWDWEYEPQGFVFNGIWYQPDFLLHNVNIVTNCPYGNETNTDLFVEIKGVLNDDAINKAQAARDCGFNLYMLGRIPDGNTDREILQNLKKLTCSEPYHHLYYFYHQGMHCKAHGKRCPRLDTYGESPYWIERFEKEQMAGICEDCMNSYNQVLWVGSDNKPTIGVWHTRQGRPDGDPAKTLVMFEHARQARFDHGHHGYEEAINY